MFGFRKRLDRLDRAVKRAEGALESGQRGGIADALTELRAARRGWPRNELGLLAERVDAELERWLAAQEDEGEASSLGGCPCCGGLDLFVSGDGRVEDIFVDDGSVHIPFRVIACASCGDLRFRALEPGSMGELRNAWGKLAFRPVRAKSRSGGPWR